MNMCESQQQRSSDNSNNDKEPTNLVWQQWTATFRASRRLKNDLLTEEGIDATVERHMSLHPNKKRSLFDEDESDSDDESNYYKLDVHRHNRNNKGNILSSLPPLDSYRNKSHRLLPAIPMLFPYVH